MYLFEMWCLYRMTYFDRKISSVMALAFEKFKIMFNWIPR